MVFALKCDYWANCLSLFEINSSPHVAQIVTPFFHPSPITGENFLFFRQDSAIPHGVFERILYLSLMDFQHKDYTIV
jgi:hypothetical protein